MFKKLLLTSFVLLNLITIIYPSKKENTKLFDYCFTLEKILYRNSIKKRERNPEKVFLISKEIAKFGVSKSKGILVNNIITKYKNYKNSFFINLFPNKLYCLSGYWIEIGKPGTFESIIYKKGLRKINDIEKFRNEIDDFINDINSEYKNLKKGLKIIF
tara:strand:- start:140 stop:616 length:477 start_codon:yes stop_codon:yes gene_type:complete